MSHASVPTPPPHDPLAGWPIVIEIPVAWGEMDANGHVNNIVFFRYFESARIEYLVAIDFVGGSGAGIGPILGSTNCRFRRPIVYPDRLRVGARSTAVAEDRFTMEYAIVSEAGGHVAAQGGGVVVAYDYGRGAKAALPAAVRAAIERLEAGGRPG
jgi:acyl-CoA thioester hydrolase